MLRDEADLVEHAVEEGAGFDGAVAQRMRGIDARWQRCEHAPRRGMAELHHRVAIGVHVVGRDDAVHTCRDPSVAHPLEHDPGVHDRVAGGRHHVDPTIGRTQLQAGTRRPRQRGDQVDVGVRFGPQMVARRCVGHRRIVDRARQVIADLHGASQAKLLRVLQEGEFHRVGGEQTLHVAVRVLSATNRDLSVLVEQEKFREDLYYRLSVVPIRVPALRERPQDLRPLAQYFLEDFCARNNFRSKSLEDGVFCVFEGYAWPGNARELKNAIERMAILTQGDRLTVESVPVEIRMPRDTGARSSVQEARESAERDHILRALEETNWNVSGAARALGMDRTNLHKRIRTLGLTRER